MLPGCLSLRLSGVGPFMRSDADVLVRRLIEETNGDL